MFQSSCSDFHSRILPVFDAVLSEGLIITGIRYWFATLSNANKDFSTESIDILYCWLWNIQTLQFSVELFLFNNLFDVLPVIFISYGMLLLFSTTNSSSLWLMPQLFWKHVAAIRLQHLQIIASYFYFHSTPCPNLEIAVGYMFVCLFFFQTIYWIQLHCIYPCSITEYYLVCDVHLLPVHCYFAMHWCYCYFIQRYFMFS